MMLPLPEYMATWVMTLLLPSLKNTRSPGRRLDFATFRPYFHCLTGLSGSRRPNFLKTTFVWQEQSSFLMDRQVPGGDLT